MNKRPTVKGILYARAYFAQHPDGTISTGLWSDPQWDRAGFINH